MDAIRRLALMRVELRPGTRRTLREEYEDYSFDPTQQGGMRKVAKIYAVLRNYPLNYTIEVNKYRQYTLRIFGPLAETRPTFIIDDKAFRASTFMKTASIVELQDIFAKHHEEIAAERTHSQIEKWQSFGLLQNNIVWKHVTRDAKDPNVYRGNLGAPYRFGSTLEYGMACAGPFGAMRDFGYYEASNEDAYKESHYVMAIKGRLVADQYERDGVFDVYDIQPVALYRILKFDKAEGELSCQLLLGPDVWPD